MRDIVVTGRGVVSPFGTSLAGFIHGFLDNRVEIAASPWSQGDHGLSAWYSAVRDFVPSNWMSDRVEAGTDLFAQFAISAAVQAVEEAGLEVLPSRRTAVVHGTSMGGTRALGRAQYDLEHEGLAGIDRKTAIKVWPNMAAAQMAIRWSLHGPQITVCTACASSIDAIGTAMSLIEGGRADVALVGGTEGGFATSSGEADGDFMPAMFPSQAAFGMTSSERDPLRASLPFDSNRSGIVTGEGSAMVVLESGDHARKRGARILGRVLGYGSLADAFHPSAPQPDGTWEREAMQEALDDARVVPEDVDAVLAHATATPKGDTAEIHAINDVYSKTPNLGQLPVVSLKGHIGHPGAASGAMGALVGLHAINEGVLPNVAGTTDVDPEVRFHVVTEEPIHIDANIVQINAFGFGGQDSSLVIGGPS